MRYSLRLTILFATLLALNASYGQRKPKIKGNRSVVTVEKELPPFRNLVLSENLDITLEPGDSEMIKIEADDNLIDVLRFDVADETLTISSFYTITGSKKLELVLVYRQLEEIRLETGGLYGEEILGADRLQLTLMENAKSQLNIRAALMHLEMEGSTSSELRIDTDSLKATLGGTSKAFIYASPGGMNLSMTKQSSVELEGVTESLVVSLTDNSKFKGIGMEAQQARVFLNESANARVKAISSLSYEGRGKSKLFLYGQPDIQILGMYDNASIQKVPK